MDLLLWRWSTTAQITSALMIAVFFVVMARSVRRVEMRLWVGAWLANLGALLVTSVYWLFQPKSPAVFTAIGGGYFLGKTIFIVLLGAGAWRFVRQRPSVVISRVIVAGPILFSVVASLTVATIDGIGVTESAVMGGFLGACAVILLLKRIPGAGWLAAGFAIRAVLAAIETLAYAHLGIASE